MASLIAHYEFENDNSDSVANRKGISRGNVVFRGGKFGRGIIFNFSGVMEISPIPLNGDYSIGSWFEMPLPETSLYYNSLCSGGKNSPVPVLIQKSNNHLGVWNPEKNGEFIDSGFDMSVLSEGRHFLLAIADDAQNTTTFYIDNIQVGISKFKSKSKITQIGNNGADELGFYQNFGWLFDFRLYDKKLNDDERNSLYASTIQICNNMYDEKIDQITSLELRNVSKCFFIDHEKTKTVYEYILSMTRRNKKEKLSILKNISFTVKKGEMLGVVGLNGSGKTTLLKIIAAILNPDSGEIYRNGSVIPLMELGIGFNGELTAKDNIIQYGVILGFTNKEIKSKINQIIKFAELEKFLDTKLKNFSSGMYARLAFSTAIEIDPDILLIDEVLSVGDITFQEKSFNAIMEFKKRGKTIVFVSHALNQIKEHCDKALWIHDGILQSFGDPNKVVNEYEFFALNKKGN